MGELGIRIEHLRKRYGEGDTAVDALKDVNMTVAPGEVVGLIGPSGSGKSTLLNLLGCIDLPTEGEVEICGHNTTQKREKELADIRRNNIGFIFQAFNLIPVLSVYENVEYALILKKVPEADRPALVDEIIEQVGLTAHKHHRPNQLSGGQRQRVAIARALVTNPRLVLADEPTANLDSATGKSILELMRRMNEKHKTTFVFATHDPDVLSFARRQIRIHDGKIESDKGAAKAAAAKRGKRK